MLAAPDSAVNFPKKDLSVKMSIWHIGKKIMPEQENYKFTKPVIILAAPRSGSTLLFELLSKAKDIWTIGDESHAVFESTARFNPASGLCNSNRLLASDADEISISLIRQRFYNLLRDRDGGACKKAWYKPRLLEKTPKNSLRIPFLNEVFPDAMYIFLYRNPRDNVSSIIDGWNAQRFITYPKLNGRDGSWSFLLPPGWENMNNKPLADIAYFQWEATTSIILNDLQTLIPENRWRAISYSNIVNNTEQVISDLCDFGGVEFDSVLQDVCRGELKMSRYTLSAPSPTKWHKHAAELDRVLAPAQRILDRLKRVASMPLDSDFDIDIPADLIEQNDDRIRSESNHSGYGKLGRNSPCPCGSALKYKQCHGKL
ncbi:MAG: sulfotransferase [Nitrosomonas sp.]|nr:sulfotransferase [Nitrosomonas sp.]